jgi:hypothetical protein
METMPTIKMTIKNAPRGMMKGLFRMFSMEVLRAIGLSCAVSNST